MGIKRFLATVAAASALSLGAFSTQAAVVCNGCSYAGDPGTFLGVHDGTTNDLSSYQHLFPGIVSTAFTDRWVFDIAPTSDSSNSADYTILAEIIGFTATLHNGTGSVCAGGPGSLCASVTVGALIASDSDPDPERYSLIATLAPGRYVFVVTGTTNTDGDSAYTGQINFEAVRQVPEPATLALLGIALAGLGFVRRRT